MIELKKSFKYNAAKEGQFPLLFQKEIISVIVTIEQKDSVTAYHFLLEQANLPKPKDFSYAEDLLQLTLHEYLISVFGQQNVLKDVFYFSEKDLTQCSVLFPNSNRTLVFVWKDEENYRDPSFLIVGGHIQTEKSMQFDNQIEQNVWRSNQGLYTGMSLSELQTLNGQDIKFYGCKSDYAGAVMPQTKGKINFDRIGCVLNYLNCAGSANYQKPVVNSGDALSDDKKFM
ncbi:MAG: hypothetical protein C4330_07145 [Chitinophagaceae bacterium]